VVFEGDKPDMTNVLSNRETEYTFLREKVLGNLLEKTYVSRMYHSIIHKKKEDSLYRFDFIPKAA
jgi:hypothetical protein